MIKCQKAKTNATAKGDDPLLCRIPIPLPLYIPIGVVTSIVIATDASVTVVVNARLGDANAVSFDTRFTEHQSRRETMKCKVAECEKDAKFIRVIAGGMAPNFRFRKIKPPWGYCEDHIGWAIAEFNNYPFAHKDTLEKRKQA